MNKENERITYDEFMMMFNIAPRMCYTLYEKAEDEIEKLKKQKDDGIDWIKNNYCYVGKKMTLKPYSDLKDLLRMLGETDE